MDRLLEPISRRDVVSSAAALSAVVGTTRVGAAPLNAGTSISAVGRSWFGPSLSIKYMNVGTAGSMPRAVRAAAVAELERSALLFEDGYGTYPSERRILARSFGCNPEELAITTSTSDSLLRCFIGLDWTAGDEILLTDQEHAGLTTPARIVSAKFGAVVKTVALPVRPDLTADEIVALFEQAI